MMKLRITYEKNEPFNLHQLIKVLRDNGYNIIDESRQYEMRNGEHYNVYINIEKDPEE